MVCIQCSVQCGNGTQHRRVYCAVTDGNVVSVRPPADCYDMTRMAEKQHCVATDCPLVWFTGAYGAVSVQPLLCAFVKFSCVIKLVRHCSRRRRPTSQVLLTVTVLSDTLIVFTALHGMQTRSSDENYVCLSVCQTRGL